MEDGLECESEERNRWESSNLLSSQEKLFRTGSSFTESGVTPSGASAPRSLWCWLSGFQRPSTGLVLSAKKALQVPVWLMFPRTSQKHWLSPIDSPFHVLYAALVKMLLLPGELALAHHSCSGNMCVLSCCSMCWGYLDGQETGLKESQGWGGGWWEGNGEILKNYYNTMDKS